MKPPPLFCTYLRLILYLRQKPFFLGRQLVSAVSHVPGLIKMNIVDEFLKCCQFLLSVPLQLLHWTTFKVLPGIRDWYPLALCQRESKYALMILNQPLALEFDYAVAMWNRATFRATVDGGTNQWYKFAQSAAREIYNPIPDLITGDFDSAEPRCLSHFRMHGAQVVHTPDQDETDFYKGVRYVRNELEERKIQIDAVVAVCENTGRLDHILSNLNTLQQSPGILGNVPLFLRTRDSLSWVLHRGRHRIHVHDQVMNGHCGLIPLGHPAVVTSSGFKWDMTGTKLEFGGLISTCNKFTEQQIVTIETDNPVLFTMTLPA